MVRVLGGAGRLRPSPLAMSDLGQWLYDLGLPQYVAAFDAQAIKFDQLADLLDAVLRELGVATVVYRKHHRALAVTPTTFFVSLLSYPPH